MIYIEILLATLCATSMMTLFSYAVSESFRKLYKEPVLLEVLMTAFRVELSANQKQVAAWLLHYVIGLFFVIVYYLPIIIEKDWYSISWTSGLIFGAIAGTVGVIWWKTMFELSNKERMSNSVGYYVQLFIAHLIFGLTVVAVHYLMHNYFN